MRNIPLILSKEDYKLLADQYASASIPAFNKHKLFVELMDAKIVTKQYIPLNVVSSTSDVLISNIKKHQTFSIHIMPAGDQQPGTNNIPVTDPLVIALLGYPAGAETEWEMKDGVNKLKIISVDSAGRAVDGGR
ncbi:GreA/GreB family elongation factor [Mucilaginibacter aquariorum]|uniref:GreA/GreB family elongation factor n=1 Tax=Mucilaginibacter aquariorum TaxID=2967225 RepID=A0ABT1T1E8_9SPHI|nr:GreA/GreB family elongation factor [Mucilaginibacter aquariorum]MCQ6958342.1 GreA/GreB family elongation factor [Mucilaginibacter aquariorum]